MMALVLLQSSSARAAAAARPTPAVPDASFGIRAAVQMFRAGELTVQQFLALCEEAAELVDGETTVCDCKQSVGQPRAQEAPSRRAAVAQRTSFVRGQ